MNLEGWAFVYDKTSIPLPDTELSAGGYAVLYKAGREISVADGADGSRGEALPGQHDQRG